MIKALYCSKREEVVTWEECFRCSRMHEVKECDIIPEYINYVKKQIEDEVSPEITATKILYCPRRSFLYAFKDLIVPVEDLYFAMRGSLAHLILEHYKVEDNCITETRFYKEIDGVKISGKPDKIDLKTKTLFDYKTISGKMTDDYSLRWGNARKKDQIQVNIYYWLVKEKFDIDTLEIVYLASDCIKRIPIKIRKEGTKYYEDIEKAFERARILGKFWNKGYNEGDKLPPKEENWLCSYCWVKDTCREYERKLKEEV